MLITVGSTEEYFAEAIGQAVRERRQNVSETVQSYLVRLMTEFARADNVFAGTNHGEQPILAVMLSRAQDAPPTEAAKLYKHLGDQSLYLGGYFTEAIEATPVGIEYYVSMGGAAYASVASLSRSLHAEPAALYMELSARFEELVDLLATVSLVPARNQSLSDEKLLQLIERYQRTGRREVLETLAAHGVVMRPGATSDPTAIN